MTKMIARPIATLCAALLAMTVAATAMATPPPVRPKLIVTISVDQFSADLFAQYRGRFVGGLKRLQSGVVFPSGYQSHAATETCPGHSVILSGRYPAHTGMVGNGYWDPARAATVYCIDDPASPSATGGPARGPGPLRASTLGAWLKDADPASQVWAVAGKDRAAVPMAGARGDGVFWWNETAGGFTTYVPEGTTAAARLAPVAGFNTALLAGWKARAPQWVPRDRQCTALNGKRRYGQFDIDHKVPPAGWTPPARGSGFANDPAFQNWFRASPEFDRATLDLAARLVIDQRLGTRASTDLLIVGLSATDYVGHRYGSQGPEMCDQLAWLDARLGAFLARLDALKLAYVVALTADHGSIDAAERAAEHGAPAARLDTASLLGGLNADLQKQFNLDYQPLTGDGSQLQITDFGTPDAALRAKIAETVVARLRALPQVAEVHTKAEVLATPIPRGKSPERWTILERLAASNDRERSGDIQIVWQEFASFGVPGVNAQYIAGHGSAWDYDRRVPILFWWPGVTGFEQPIAVEVVDVAPTLAAIAGIKVPPVDGRCLDLDAGPASSCPR